MNQIKRHIAATFCVIGYSSSSLVAQTQITGSGNTTYLPKFTGASTVVNSIINENTNACIGVGTTPLIGEFVSFQKNQISETKIGLRNMSSGAAFTSFNVQSVGSMIKMAAYHLTYSGTGMAQANTGVLSTTGNLNIGTLSSSTASLTLWTNNTSRMTIKSTGEVGIGTASPASQLDILSTASQLRLSNSATVYSNINTDANGNLLFNLSNTTASIGFGVSTPATGVGFHSNMGVFRLTDPTYMPQDQSLFRGLQFIPSRSSNGDIPSGTTISSMINNLGEGLSLATCNGGDPGVKLGAYAFGTGSGGWSSMWETENTAIPNVKPNLLLTKNGGRVGIGTGANTPRATLDVMGTVKIGTQLISAGSNNDAILFVAGKMVAQSCYITMTNWADYVFAKDYKLPNLYDIEKYYLANKHLPEIPSEKEVIENGIDVAEMNKLLLKKIEELTILMVKQQKDIDVLKQK